MSSNSSAAAVVYTLVKDASRHEREIGALDGRVGKLEVTVGALGAKIAVYATIGASVGGALVTLVTTLLLR